MLLGLLFLSSLALIFSAASFDRRLNQVRDADTDNQGWIVSQLEVDHLALVIAVEDAFASTRDGGQDGGQVSPEAWNALQREFDVFYSRIGVFLAAMQRADLPEAFVVDLAELRGVRDRLTARIDSLARDDLEGLEAFSEHLRSKQPLVRRLVTHGLQVFVDEAQTAREQEREIWLFFLIETLLLLSLVLIAAIFAFRLSRALQQRTAQAERAASTITKAYEASLSAVVVTDFDGRVILCNKAAETMFRLPMEEITGSDVRKLAPPRLVRSLAATFDRMRALHATDAPCDVSRRTLAARSDGQVFPVELALTTDTDADGQPIAIAFIRDISAQVKAENALRGALTEARRAAAAKSMFLATMSHEMRTPLHGLIAALDLIDRGALGETDAGLFDTARDCSQRALALVNDVLQFTRASAMREPPVAFSPARIAQEVVNELSPFARENGNEIVLRVTGPGAQQRVQGYPAAFSRSLYNLVGNAVKFTASGQIEVALSFSDPEPKGPLHLSVSVTDEGPGIAAADRERIFELFETSADHLPHHTLATGLNGTGLGLPITRLAVERMGGQIRLDSEIGKGSRFWFDITLPRATGSVAVEMPMTQRAAPIPTGVVWDVLVVDDNEVNLTLMREMVLRLGHRVTLAHDGKEAVELARDRHFDVILMDINMPVMDGRSAALAIRQGGLCREAVIIAVSALIEAEEPEALRSCGIDRALVKPVRLEVLATTLRDVAQSLGQVPGRPDAPEAPPKTAAAAAPDTTPAKGFDFRALSKMVGRETAVDLVRATLKDARDVLDKAQAQAPETGQVAHRALGGAAVIGLEDLAATLREIEYAAQAEDRDSLIELAEILDELLSTLGAEIEAIVQPEKAGS